MKGNLICRAGSKLQLQQMINRYFDSKNWIIIEDGSGTYKAYNMKTGETTNHVIRNIRGRWRFELKE